MRTFLSILISLVISFLFLQCSDSTSSTGGNPTEGELNVSGNYEASFNFVLSIYDDVAGEYTGVLATQSLNPFTDEYGFGLYSNHNAIFTKMTESMTWIGYTAYCVDASYDISDTLKPRLIANNIVLYYDSTYTGFGFWEFDPDNLDSSKWVIVDGDMSTDYRKLGQ